MEEEKDIQEKTYLQKFNNLLAEYDELDTELNAIKGQMSDADYADMKNELDSERNATIERMEYERNTYNMMATDEDRENYYNYDRIISGEFNDKDAADIRYYMDGGEPTVFTYSQQFNRFFTNSKNEIADDRTIEMGEPLYNKILDI